MKPIVLLQCLFIKYFIDKRKRIILKFFTKRKILLLSCLFPNDNTQEQQDVVDMQIQNRMEVEQPDKEEVEEIIKRPVKSGITAEMLRREGKREYKRYTNLLKLYGKKQKS